MTQPHGPLQLCSALVQRCTQPPWISVCGPTVSAQTELRYKPPIFALLPSWTAKVPELHPWASTALLGFSALPGWVLTRWLSFWFPAKRPRFLRRCSLFVCCANTTGAAKTFTEKGHGPFLEEETCADFLRYFGHAVVDGSSSGRSHSTAVPMRHHITMNAWVQRAETAGRN